MSDQKSNRGAKGKPEGTEELHNKDEAVYRTSITQTL